jgi:hypothetical protein
MPAARNRSVLSQGSQSYKRAKVAAKRLEEAALSYKGDERVQLLRRWLVVLKETQRDHGGSGAATWGQSGPDCAPAGQHPSLATRLVCRIFWIALHDPDSLGAEPPVLAGVAGFVHRLRVYDSGAEPMNFFHVFLYSQALECVVLSLVSWICGCLIWCCNGLVVVATM